MKTNIINKRPAIIAGAIAGLLAVPFIAMKFSGEVNWTASDFIVAGVILGATGFALEMILRKITNRTAKIVAVVTLFIALLLLWAELAVGLFGSPIAGT